MRHSSSKRAIGRIDFCRRETGLSLLKREASYRMDGRVAGCAQSRRAPFRSWMRASRSGTRSNRTPSELPALAEATPTAGRQARLTTRIAWRRCRWTPHARERDNAECCDGRMRYGAHLQLERSCPGVAGFRGLSRGSQVGPALKEYVENEQKKRMPGRQHRTEQGKGDATHLNSAAPSSTTSRDTTVE